MTSSSRIAAALAALSFAVPVSAYGPDAAAETARGLSTPFTIAVLPDTQAYSEDPELTIAFEKQVEWVLEHRKDWNIVLVTQLGDVVDNGADAAQWARATAALRPLLEQDRLPFSIVRGNHDDPAFFLENLPLALMQEKPWFVGAAPSGLTQAQTFKVDGLRFLHVGFQKDPSAEEVAWANALLREPELQGLPVVVSTHDYLGLSGRTATGTALWESFVRDNPMVFMVLNGHMHNENARVSHDAANRPVYQMLSDYQDRELGGNGRMRLVTVDPVAGSIQVRTFSPYHRVKQADGTYTVDTSWYETDWNSDLGWAVDVRERLAWDTTYDFGAEPPPPPPPPLDAIPADQPYTHVFQNRRPLAGTADVYGQTVDTQMNENNATLDYAGEPAISTDLDDAGSRVQALLRFDGVVGDGPGRIAAGSTVASAKLLFHVLSGTKGTVGVHRMLQPWTEKAVWMDFTPVDAAGAPTWIPLTFLDPASQATVTLPRVMAGGGVDADGVEAMALPDASFTCKKPIPVPFAVDVTAAVQAWVGGQENLGWAFLSDSTDGWDFSSGDGEQPPALVVVVEGAPRVQ